MGAERGEKGEGMLQEGRRTSTHQSWLFIWNWDAPRSWPFSVISEPQFCIWQICMLILTAHAERVGAVPETYLQKGERGRE